MKTTFERRDGFIIERRGILPPKTIRDPQPDVEAPPMVTEPKPNFLIAEDVARQLRGRINFPREFYEGAA